MFIQGFTKQASIGTPPKPKVNPVTAQDALGARSDTFKPIGSGFGKGHHPKAGLKPLSAVRRVKI